MLQTFSHPIVRLERQSKGIKAKDIAAKLEISASYYSELEAGKKPWPPELIRKLSEEFGIGTPIKSDTGQSTDSLQKEVSAILEDSHRSPFAKHTEPEIWEFIREAAHDAATSKPLNKRLYLTNIQDAAEELKRRLPSIQYKP